MHGVHDESFKNVNCTYNYFVIPLWYHRRIYTLFNCHYLLYILWLCLSIVFSISNKNFLRLNTLIKNNQLPSIVWLGVMIRIFYRSLTATGRYICLKTRLPVEVNALNWLIVCWEQTAPVDYGLRADCQEAWQHTVYKKIKFEVEFNQVQLREHITRDCLSIMAICCYCEPT